MIALDTSVLLSLLEGGPGTRELMDRLRGVEVATTEANLIELGFLASRGPPRQRKVRLQALDRLRHRITVLPIDARAVETAAVHLGKVGAAGSSPLVAAMMGALEANGCDELLTLDASEDLGKWKVRISRSLSRNSK